MCVISIIENLDQKKQIKRLKNRLILHRQMKHDEGIIL